MRPALRIRLRPTTPWRTGSPHGGRDAVEPLFHSDSLFGAVSAAFGRLGGLKEWLASSAATTEPAVRLSSCFPFLEQMDFVPPPMSHWPPPHSSHVRWSSARLAPASLITAILSGEMPKEERWVVDGHTGCLLPVDRRGVAQGPFRYVTRGQAAVDRVTGGMVAPHRAAALQFAPNAGMWCVAVFQDDEAAARWTEPLKSALALLADSGFGGMRSHGFGRASAPEFESGMWPAMVLNAPATDNPAWWLLSLMTPAGDEKVDWSTGAYGVKTRGGRVESPSAWGAEKRESSMVAEGSVLACAEAPRGAAEDVAPEGFAHSVWRAGFAVAVPIPAAQGGRAA